MTHKAQSKESSDKPLTQVINEAIIESMEDLSVTALRQTPDSSEVVAEIVEETLTAEEAPAEATSEDLARCAAVIESLLFVTDRPLTPAQLRKVMPEFDKELVKKAITKLKADYASGRGVQLEEIAGGLQLRTIADHAPWIKRLVASRPVRLSQAALEVLAIVAYRQPITRAGIEHIRGVDCGASLKTLMERNLLKTIGKLEEPGRPMLFATSTHFLEVFSLKSLSDLPTLKEFQELTPEESAELNLVSPKTAEELDNLPREENFMEAGDEDGDALSVADSDA